MYVQNWFVRPNENRTSFRHLLDGLKIIFIFQLNVFQSQSKFMRKIFICLLSEKHFNFMIRNLMTLFEDMQNRWILFVKDFEILAPSWIDTELLVKPRAIKRDKVWKKKILVKNLERAKPRHSEQETGSQGGKSWWVGWVCLICKVTLEVSLI